MIARPLALAASLLAAVPAPSGAACLDPHEDVSLLDHATLTRELESLAASSADLTVVEIGRSRAGRAIHALRLAPETAADQPGRPAILVVGGLEGPNAWTSSLIVAELRALASDAPTFERATFWFVPRANPDACEARFATPLAEIRGSGEGFDDDRDGRNGEDGLADIDGDGLVTWMRWEDPEGEWISDPSDERALRRARPARGERGRWKLAREARDLDGDEAYGEDPPHDAEVNRNFPQAFEEHTPRAGRFATSEPEARALCDFVLAHPELALVVCYGELDWLAHKPKSAGKGERGRGRGRIPARALLADDSEWLAELARRYREATDSKVTGEEDDAGTFQAWCYHHRGLWTLAIRPWAVPAERPEKGKDRESDEAPPEDGEAAAQEERAADQELSAGAEEELESAAEPAPGERERGAQGRGRRGKEEGSEEKPSEDALRLAQLEALGLSGRFIPWHATEHPELGTVEVGGFAPYALVEPPPATIADLATQQGAFLAQLPATLARVRLADVRARVLAEGLAEITCAVENDSLLPLMSAAARRTRTARPARVDLVLPPGAERLAGEAVQLVRELAGSGGRHELRWLVRVADPATVTIRLQTQNAGTDEAHPEVER